MVDTMLYDPGFVFTTFNFSQYTINVHCLHYIKADTGDNVALVKTVKPELSC